MAIAEPLPTTVSVIVAFGGGGSSGASGAGSVATTGAPSSGAGRSNLHVPLHWPNQSLLTTLRKIDQIHSRMKAHPDPQSGEWLREARDGGLYGRDADS